MLERGDTRLIVNISDIRQHNSDLSQGLLRRPMEFFMPLQTAVQELALSRPGRSNRKIPKNSEFSVGLTGQSIQPRQQTNFLSLAWLLIHNFLHSLSCFFPRRFRW